jgi:oligoribonuclease
MILWCDTETTGLDRQSDWLLECAMVVTEDDLNEIGAATRTVGWNERFMGRPLRQFIRDDFVVEMHTKNGLLDDVANVIDYGHAAMDDFFFDWLGHCGIKAEDKVPLGGASVDFDRDFLRRFLPNSHGLLGYRNINISTIRELAKRWCPNIPEPPKAEAHRALADIRESIELARYYRRNIFHAAGAVEAFGHSNINKENQR